MNRLHADFTEDGASRAVLLASDQGYSLPQIVEAVHDGRLAANGDISGQNHAFTPFNFLIDDMVSSSSSALSADSPYTVLVPGISSTPRISQVVDKLNRTGNALGGSPGLAILLELLDSGYNQEQIVDAFLFDYIIGMNTLENIALIDPDTGRVIEPANNRNEIFENEDGYFNDKKITQTFICANGRIISADLVCNGVDTCGDGSDEKDDICGSGVQAATFFLAGVAGGQNDHQPHDCKCVGRNM